ncbi:hypothetical protein [Candidatus Electrothrix sp.]|uniref:hypothetical protein n=1 Tax=Candidatus Electrothrix sp. TaxID=2170559 RepID=UPI004057382C
MEEELPKSETELIAEARKIIDLLTNDPRFANVPISADELRKRLDKFIAVRNAEEALRVAEIQATAAVEEALNDLLETERELAAANKGSSVQSITWN